MDMVYSLCTRQMAIKLQRTTVSWLTEWQTTLTLWCTSSLHHQIIRGSKQLKWSQGT